MNKDDYKYRTNMSSNLNPAILAYDKLLYKRANSDNIVRHYTCRTNRIALIVDVIQQI